MKKEIKNMFKFVIYSLASILPAISLAQNLSGIRTLLIDVGDLIRIAQPIVFGLALLYFFWGIATFILNAGDAKLREEGKQRMIWGVIAMFVLVSIFGIINYLGILTGINPCGNNLPGCIPGTP